MTPYLLVSIYRRLNGAWCLDLKSQAVQMHYDTSKCSVTTYKTRRRHGNSYSASLWLTQMSYYNCTFMCRIPHVTLSVDLNYINHIILAHILDNRLIQFFLRKKISEMFFRCRKEYGIFETYLGTLLIGNCWRGNGDEAWICQFATIQRQS